MKQNLYKNFENSRLSKKLIPGLLSVNTVSSSEKIPQQTSDKTCRRLSLGVKAVEIF